MKPTSILLSVVLSSAVALAAPAGPPSDGAVPGRAFPYASSPALQAPQVTV